MGLVIGLFGLIIVLVVVIEARKAPTQKPPKDKGGTGSSGGWAG